MPNLPTGTVTFLFTDIEGSAARWERDRAAMARALERHNAILDRAIATHGGHVFKTVGDAYCAAFANAGSAVEVAIDAQRALHMERWDEMPPGFEPLLVRIASMAQHVALDGDRLLVAADRGGLYDFRLGSWSRADWEHSYLPNVVWFRSLRAGLDCLDRQ